MQKKCIIFFIALAFCLLPVIAIHAQTAAFNITTTPQFFDIAANPGDTVTKTIHVRNNTDSKVTLQIRVEKLTPDTNGQIILRDFTKADIYASWLSVVQSSIAALPKEWSDVPFTISIPKTAAFGYYYAILISSHPPTEQTSIATHLSGAVAIPILLTVNSKGAVADARLLSFQPRIWWTEYLPVDLLTTFKNTGNVHVRPTGTIFITDSFGNQIAKLSVNQNAGAVLPNATRTFDSSWNDSFITYDPKVEDGNAVVDRYGKPQMQLNFHFDRVFSLRMGKYTATEVAVVSGQEKDITFQNSITFFVFPWKIIGGFLLILILATIGLWNIIRNIWQHGKKLLQR